MACQTTEADREKFELYLFEMSDVVERLIQEAAQAGYNLDFTLESLDRLEAYTLAAVTGADDPERIVQRAARYYGEHYGGKWRYGRQWVFAGPQSMVG